MKGIVKLSLMLAGFGVGISDSLSQAADGCCDSGVTYHGRIVVKIRRSCLGAAAPPLSPVLVQSAPTMMAVPYVAMQPALAPTIGAYPFALPMVPMAPAASPVAAAPASPAAPSVSAEELTRLRSNVNEMREEMINLVREVKAIRSEMATKPANGN